MQLLSYVILITVILFVTLIHELGHLILAKSLKVPVDIFAVGFGPNLYTYEDKQKTKWSINLIPLGGYISIANPEENEVDAMLAISPIKRIIVALGGPLFNILSFFVIGNIFYTSVGPKSYYYQEYQEPHQGFRYIIYKSQDQHILFNNINRGETQFVPLLTEDMNKQVESQTPAHHPISLKQSIKLCNYQFINTVRMTFKVFTSLKALGELKSFLASTKSIHKNLEKDQQSIFMVFIIYFLLFSLGVGVCNLLPFFGLDGGWVILGIINMFIRFSKRGERILAGFLNYGTMLLFAGMFILVARDLLGIFLEFFM